MNYLIIILINCFKNIIDKKNTITIEKNEKL